MSDKAILKGKEVVPVDDLLAWAKWFDTNDRRVGHAQVGDAKVSTVFLGLDHSFGIGPRLWFETMIFGGEHDGYQERYSTWDEAVEGHARAVRLVSPCH